MRIQFRNDSHARLRLGQGEQAGGKGPEANKVGRVVRVLVAPCRPVEGVVGILHVACGW
jgi:hypothetical protein